MAINCCKSCVAPKRFPGCHGSCQEYTAEKTEYDRRKAEYYKEDQIRSAIYNERYRKVNHALKGYRGNKLRER